MSKGLWLLAVLIFAAGASSASAQTTLTYQSFESQGGSPITDGTFTENADGTVTLVPEAISGHFLFGPLDGPQPPNFQSFGGGTVLFQQTPDKERRGERGERRQERREREENFPTATIELLAATKGFSASEFGAWRTFDGDGNPTSTTFFAAGKDIGIPGSGSGVAATYNGGYIVVVHHNTTNGGRQVAAGTYSGSMTMAADFDAQRLRATFGGFLTGTTTPVFPGQSPFVGNHFDFGNTTGSRFDQRVFGVQGAFYGSGSVPPEAVGEIRGTVGSSAFTGVFWTHS
jgi:hypothetical protein